MKENQNAICFGQEEIGPEDKKEKRWINLCDQARLSNLLVLSTKNSGKSKFLMPQMFKQDLGQKDAGITVITGHRDIAYQFYAMAKNEKKKIHLLKPSVDFEILNNFLYAKEWNYDYINEKVIDYKQAIRDKDIVIIDMEYDRYSLFALKATAMLLMQLQVDMKEVDTTLLRKHYVYIDDAYRYLEYISTLLESGNDFNVATTLFFQSRSQFVTAYRDYTGLIDNNVRNTILLQGISFDDAQYYAKRFGTTPNEFTFKKYGEFSYELLREDDFVVQRGHGRLMTLSDDELESINQKAIRAKKKLSEEMKVDCNDRTLQMTNEVESIDRLNKKLSKWKLNKSSYLDAIEASLSTHSLPTTQDQNSAPSQPNSLGCEFGCDGAEF